MINNPEVVAQIAALHEQYEAALVSNDVEKLLTFFWDSPHALRFGIRESLYGARAIDEFRRNRPPIDLAREVSNLTIVTFADECAVVTLEFDRSIQGAKSGENSTRAGESFRRTFRWSHRPMSTSPHR